jgi:predicted anti-sigma-YlaC factor YlaD
MRCRTAERWISRDLDRPLARGVREALEAHLAVCPECRAMASDVRCLRARLGEVRCPEPLPHFWTRLEARLTAAPAAPPQAIWLRWSLRAIPASLALIAGFLGAMVVFLPGTAETNTSQALLFGEENPIVETRTILDDDKPGNRDIAVLFASDERPAGSIRRPRP